VAQGCQGCEGGPVARWVKARDMLGNRCGEHRHHQSDEPLDCSLAVSVESEELSDVPYGCSFGLDLPAFGGHAGAEAQRRLQGLIEQVLLVAVALLPLHAHRVGSDCSIR
jgi:hypothetical protein